jgi:pyridoxamine 5'-phosphate oxidase
LPLLVAWFEEAAGAGRQPNPDAMVLATSTPTGRPSARVVLCKGIDAGAGELVFYTNYRSRKGSELGANPLASGVFHWDHAGRQARVEGTIRRTTGAESDAYFASRPLVSRIGAWASEQGRPLASRAEMQERVADAISRLGLSLEQVLGGDEGVRVPRPDWWGGFRMTLLSVELWVSGEGRLHDRAVWERGPDGPWTATRLQP